MGQNDSQSLKQAEDQQNLQHKKAFQYIISVVNDGRYAAPPSKNAEVPESFFF